VCGEGYRLNFAWMPAKKMYPKCFIFYGSWVFLTPFNFAGAEFCDRYVEAEYYRKCRYDISFAL
jgi:hypothetical protein